MGRYYTGDIEGKFWFALQDSDDATHFGGTHDYVDADGEVCEEEKEATEIYSHFDLTHVGDIEDELASCARHLGELGPIIQSLLASETGFYHSDKFIQTHFGHLGYPTLASFRPKLKIYARMSLGRKILACVKTKGVCNFASEL